MRLYEIGETVRIANVKNATFPNVVGKQGIIVDILESDTYPGLGRIYIVRIENEKYAFYGREIE